MNEPANYATGRPSDADLNFQTDVGEEDAEETWMYKKGNFHPTLLGDEFKDGRYSVVRKLGFGSYSTVWLARDTRLDRLVALKICSANSTGSNSKEIGCLTALSSSTEPGASNIVQLLDHFKHTGPNGIHDCLVLELLGYSLSRAIETHSMNHRLEGKNAVRVIRDTLQGLAFMHAQGFAHGDIHLGNIAFTFPSLNDTSGESLDQILTPLKTDNIVAKNRMPIPKRMPAYLVYSSKLKHTRDFIYNPVKIIDFGQAFHNSDRPESIRTPLIYSAPEVILGEPIDYKVDLWAVGNMMFNILVEHTFIEGGWKDLALRQQAANVEPLPERWRAKWEGIVPENDTEGASLPIEHALEEYYYRRRRAKPQLTRKVLRLLNDVICSLMRTDPDDRLSAQDALTIVEWIYEQIPDMVDELGEGSGRWYYDYGCWKDSDDDEIHDDDDDGDDDNDESEDEIGGSASETDTMAVNDAARLEHDDGSSSHRRPHDVELTGQP